jgi:hypothetical protein
MSLFKERCTSMNFVYWQFFLLKDKWKEGGSERERERERITNRESQK